MTKHQALIQARPFLKNPNNKALIYLKESHADYFSVLKPKLEFTKQRSEVTVQQHHENEWHNVKAIVLDLFLKINSDSLEHISTY